MKEYKILIFFLCWISQQVFGQDTHSYNKPILSAADSVLIKMYEKGMNRSSLYSQDRQHYLDSLLAITPENAYYWQQKSMPLFKQKKYETGMVYLDSAVLYDSNEWLDYRAFIKCIFQKSYAASIADFEGSKKLKGFNFVMDHSYDFYLGLCYLQMDKFAIADSFMQSSLRWADANFGEGHYIEYFYLGIVKMELNQDSLAISLFNRSLKIYPQFPDAQYYKAVCLKRQGHVNEALAVMTKALKNLNEGYSNNEDNAIYEEYPYQKRKYSYENSVIALQEKVK
jgi:tetratricopeptide (TPR) repeat protein